MSPGALLYETPKEVAWIGRGVEGLLKAEGGPDGMGEVPPGRAPGRSWREGAILGGMGMETGSNLSAELDDADAGETERDGLPDPFC